MRSQFNRRHGLYGLLTCFVGIVVLSLIDLHPLALKLAKSVGGTINERIVPVLAPLSEGPVRFGSLEPARGAYIEIRANFRRGTGPLYPNLFQTGPANTGVRLEVNGTTALLVAHDDRAPDRTRVIAVTQSLDGDDHRLEFQALNGQFVSGRIDGNDFFLSKPIFDVSNILLGAGFDERRPWGGSVTNATIRTGHISSAAYRATMALRPVGLVAISVLAAFLCLLMFELRVHPYHLAKRLILERSVFGGPWKHLTGYPLTRSAMTTVAFSTDGVVLSLALATTIFYHALYFNRFAPVTEGWFLGFAHLIDEGLIPYRDFQLMLPPLYTFSTWVVHHLIGDNLFQLRLIGLGVIILLFLVLQDILSVFFARWAASFASAVAIIYYQSGVASIGYDFTQFLTLYLLTGLWALERYWLNQRVANRGVAYLFISGAAFSLAILTKHSNGAVALMVMGLAFSFVVLSLEPVGAAFRQWSAFCLGVVTPLIITAVVLAYFGALEPLLQNTGADALAAKGGMNAVLFGWIRSFFDQRYLLISAEFAVALILMSGLIVSLAIGTKVLQSARKPHAPLGPVPLTPALKPSNNRNALDSADTPWPVQAMSAGSLVLVCALMLALRLAYSSTLKPWIEIGESLRSLLPAASASIYLVCAVLTGCILLLHRRQAAAPWFLLFSFGLALAAGNGTSSNTLSEISLFLGLAILIAVLLTLGSSSMAGQIPTLFLAICLCLSFARDKFAMPYGWWYLKTAPVQRTDCPPAPPLLNGLCFGPGELEKINAIVAQIRAHSTAGDSIYVYPHMPMFALLADRRPYGNAVVSWYDFMTDREASRIAADLMISPPPVIVFANLPQVVINEHEKAFRGGKPSGQRSILEAIEALTASGRLKRVLDVDHLNDVDVTVFSRSDR